LQNIFVASPGPNWGVKIGDFGISKRIATEQTALRTQAGTQQFQAPEILGYVDEAEETSEYTNAVDIWSLGCVVYLLLTKTVPFARRRSLNDFCSGRAQFPDEMLREKGVSADGTRFVEELLNPHPAQRLLADTASQHAWLEPSSLMENELKLSQQDTSRAQDAESLPQTPLPEQEVVTEVRIVNPTQQQSPGYSNIQRLQSDHLKPSQRHIDSEHPDESTTKTVFQITSNATPMSDKDASFLFFARKGTPTDLEAWLVFGAKLDARGERHRTALHIAVAARLDENVRWLLENGANPSTVDSEGNTALHLACETGRLSTILTLLKYHTQIEAENFLGNTPLHMASLKGHSTAVLQLLRNGLNVNARNKRGETPLHVAAHSDDGDFVDVIQQLLNAGANSDALDESGMTAEGLARRKDNMAVLNLLSNIRSLTSDDSKTFAIREKRAPLVDSQTRVTPIPSRVSGTLQADRKWIRVTGILFPLNSKEPTDHDLRHSHSM
jgi:ankyrin repeat protein